MSDLITLEAAFKHTDGRSRFSMLIPKAMLVDPGINFLVKHETEYGGYEYSDRCFLDAHLEPDDLFIDLGAHWGIFSLTAATRWPGQVQVIAVEASPNNVTQLNSIIKHNQLDKQIEVIHAAIGDEIKTIRLNDTTTMAFSLTSNKGNPNKTHKVQMTTVDNILAERVTLQDKRIFMKIDIEGFEVEAINGAQQTIKSGNVAAIILEKGSNFNPGQDDKKFQDMLKYLETQGFILYRFAHENMGGALIPYVYNYERCNILAIKPSINRLPCYNKPSHQHSSVEHRHTSPMSREETIRYTNGLIKHNSSNVGHWVECRHLLQGADERAIAAVNYIAPQSSVIDIGSGIGFVHKYMEGNQQYEAIDLLDFAPNCKICDLNQGLQLEKQYDYATILATLEYLHNPEQILKNCEAHCDELILSYPVKASESTDDRRANGYVNDYTLEQLKQLLEKIGWQIDENKPLNPNTVLLHAHSKRVDHAQQNQPRTQNDNTLNIDPTPRIKIIAATMLTNGSNILDLSPTEIPSKYLPLACTYTHIAMNNPSVLDEISGTYTHIVLLGALEKCDNIDALFKRLHQLQRPIITSYSPSDFELGLQRNKLGWKNHFTRRELDIKAAQAGFNCFTQLKIDNAQYAMLLLPEQQTCIPQSKVLVICQNPNDINTQQAKLRINDIMPAGASVSYMTPDTVTNPEEYDLLIIGTGNSLEKFEATESLLNLIDTIPYTIGIFGTQSHYKSRETKTQTLIEKLDYWFACHKEDLYLYEKHNNNCAHLGDWLITAFANSNSTSANSTTEKLKENKQQQLQQDTEFFRTVSKASYISYDFISLHGALLDIFGHIYPHQDFFQVNKNAMLTYCDHINKQTEKLRQLIHGLLN